MFEYQTIYFQSSLHCAEVAGDPATDEEEASGLPLLRHIVDSIQDYSIELRLGPVAEESGCTAVFESQGATIEVHLTWTTIGGPIGGPERDIWSIEMSRVGDWIGSVVRKLLCRGEDHSAGEAVFNAILAVLRENGDEYTEVCVRRWRDEKA